jgi:hypothetical protein
VADKDEESVSDFNHRHVHQPAAFTPMMVKPRITIPLRTQTKTHAADLSCNPAAADIVFKGTDATTFHVKTRVVPPLTLTLNATHPNLLFAPATSSRQRKSLQAILCHL